MNKTKIIFMQNAPKFVIIGGLSSLVVFALCGLLLSFTDEWKFGVYATLLCVTAIIFIVYVIRRFERIYKIPTSDAMRKNDERWRKDG